MSPHFAPSQPALSNGVFSWSTRPVKGAKATNHSSTPGGTSAPGALSVEGKDPSTPAAGSAHPAARPPRSARGQGCSQRIQAGFIGAAKSRLSRTSACVRYDLDSPVCPGICPEAPPAPQPRAQAVPGRGPSAPPRGLGGPGQGSGTCSPHSRRSPRTPQQTAMKLASPGLSPEHRHTLRARCPTVPHRHVTNAGKRFSLPGEERCTI